MGFFGEEKKEVKVKKPKAKTKVKHDCTTCPLDVSTQIKVDGLGE